MANQSVVLLQSLATSSTASYAQWDAGPNSTNANNKLLTFPFYSNKTTGCGHKGQTDPFHTVSYSTTSSFIGIIRLQGSLVVDPTETDWYDIPETTYGDGVSSMPNKPKLINFNGNHVWIRAVIVKFIAGQINNVLFTHN